MQVRSSLRTRLLLLIVAAVLPLCVVAVASAWFEADKALRQTQRQLRFTAELLAAQQDKLSQGAEHLLASIAAVPQVRSLDGRECAAYFSTLRGRLPIYANIGLLDLQGDVVCHANGTVGRFNVADREHFRAAVRDAAFTIGEPITGRGNGVLILPYAFPVMDVDRVAGVAFAALDLRQSASILGNVQVPPGVRLLVADRAGRILASVPPLAGGVLADPEVLAAARELRAGEGEGVDAAGARRLYAHAPSSVVGRQGFLAIASIDRLVVTSPAYAELRRNLLALAAALAASLAIGWWFGGRMIVRPAAGILRTVAELEAGNLDARAAEGGEGNAEFSKIARALNRLASAVQVREQRLARELARSRSAHETLGTVLNAMGEGLVAIDRSGMPIIQNAAASMLIPDLDDDPRTWPSRFGLYLPDRSTPYAAQQLPLMRALRGESGQSLMWMRNDRVPEGRLLQCSYRPIGQAQGPRGGLAVFVDVTELDRLQRAQATLLAELATLNADLERRVLQRTAELAREEERFRILAEQAPEVIWNTAPDGSLTYVNRRWCELVGGQAQDWLGFRWLRKIHPDDVPAVKQAWEKSRQTGAMYTGVRRVATLDGSWHAMAYRGAPVRDAAGHVQSWVGVDTDITELKQNEARLHGANRELEGFTYAVSHDLRAPLAAIAGFGAALAEKLASHPDEKVRHYVNRICVGAGRMEDLIEALLSLAQFGREPLQPAVVDLGVLAAEVLEALREADPARRVDAHVEPGLLVRGDARLLRAMLQNLLSNAWKFTARTGHARIHMGRADTAEGPAFFVADNGAGFDMDRVHRLFVPFQRLHDSADFPGTGIGLATVQRIALIHGGHVWAQSRPGEGATFFFVLPEAGAGW